MNSWRANCKGNLREKDVQQIKSERNISFPDSRKYVEPISPPGSSGQSYADAARIYADQSYHILRLDSIGRRIAND
jgi:hypothetical protein